MLVMLTKELCEKLIAHYSYVVAALSDESLGTYKYQGETFNRENYMWFVEATCTELGICRCAKQIYGVDLSRCPLVRRYRNVVYWGRCASDACVHTKSAAIRCLQLRVDILKKILEEIV